METQDLRARLTHYAYHAAWIVFVLFVIVNAWVSEDAYITLRVLDNFFHGYGLRWNIDERVQAYTHPLWLLLHIPPGFFISDLFLVDVLLSIACTAGALAVTLATARKSLPVTLMVLYLPLLSSKAFRDYSTGGLENPLSYLLFAAFGYIIIKKADHPRFWLMLSLVVNLSLLNRLDSIIFYLPTLCWLGWTRLRDIKWGQSLLGAVPLLLWFAFSLFYYGFLFPNTKYAKLDTGIGLYQYVVHGLIYAKYTAIMDTVTALVIISPLAFIHASLKKQPILFHPQQLPLCIALGIVWQVLYVIYIGGDYMIGRFWALPAFMCVWLAYMFIPEHFSVRTLTAYSLILLVVAAPFPIAKALRERCKVCHMNPAPMIDGKFMFSGNFFIPKLEIPLHFNTEAHHKFVNWAKDMVKKAPPHVEKAHFIGMLGYYAGPGNILIDELALADPLLARLPVAQKDGFFIGHFKRHIPKGYIYAVKTGSTERMDPSLAQYYEKLRIITSGDLTDKERLKTILEFNLGAYDHWKRDYLYCNVW